jgi:PAS domain S-box-containing protein
MNKTTIPVNKSLKPRPTQPYATLDDKESELQNEGKVKQTATLISAINELAFQDKGKENRAAELIIAIKELAFQNEEKEKRAAELIIANKELAFQNEEKGKRAAELIIANKELAFLNEEKGKRAAELIIANKELAFQNKEKGKKASELIVANKELAFQNEEKGKRAAELLIANKELAFQNAVKEKRAAELIIANNELAFQNEEKEKRAAELIIAVTERKLEGEAFKKSEANLRTIFDNTSILYILVDPDLKIVSFNKVAINGFSKELEKTLQAGELLINFIETEKKQRTLEMFKRVFEGEQFKLEEHFTRDNGITIWYFMQLLPVFGENRKVLNMIVYLRDITEQKLSEIERDKITSDLLLRNKDLEQFSYIISHNLRQPIANIEGLTDNLISNQLPEDEKKEVISALGISVKRLDEVILDLNTILKIRNDESEKKQYLFLSDIVKYSLVSLGSVIKKENAIIDVDFSEVEEIFTIKSYIYSIFYNLILNSIKFRQEGMTPNINIESKKLNDKIILIFTDNGIGIDLEKNTENLFGLYKRFHLQVNGKGVGLYMVKAQVESMGGKIAISSKVSKGTVFTIEL